MQIFRNCGDITIVPSGDGGTSPVTQPAPVEISTPAPAPVPEPETDTPTEVPAETPDDVVESNPEVISTPPATTTPVATPPTTEEFVEEPSPMAAFLARYTPQPSEPSPSPGVIYMYRVLLSRRDRSIWNPKSRRNRGLEYFHLRVPSCSPLVKYLTHLARIKLQEHRPRNSFSMRSRGCVLQVLRRQVRKEIVALMGSLHALVRLSPLQCPRQCFSQSLFSKCDAEGIPGHLEFLSLCGKHWSSPLQ